MRVEIRASEQEPLRVCFTGPMFSGKSTQLQEIGRKYRIAKYTVLCFHPVVHQRDKPGVVSTHMGLDFDSKPLENLDALKSAGYQLTERTVVLLEEAQFFTDLRQLLDYFGQQDVDVYFAALNMKYTGEPWEAVRDVLHTCTHLELLYAVCTRCGSTRARYSHRLIEQIGDVVIGAEDKYEPLCQPCFSKCYNGASEQ